MSDNDWKRAPAHLSLEAGQQWLRIVPLALELGTFTKADVPMMIKLCEALGHEDALRKILKQEGLTVTTSSGSTKGHPALRALERASSQTIRLLATFGMDPKSRQKLQSAPSGKGKNGARPSRQRDTGNYFASVRREQSQDN